MRLKMATMARNSVFLLLFIASAVTAQRVAPGVPPQHYQHVPAQQHPPPQYQQQQQQLHQAPGVAPQHYQPQQHQQQQQQQFVQQPVQPAPGQAQQQQQQFVQQPVQPAHGQVHQQPQHGQHHQPHGHGQPQQVLNAANMEHERAHIQEHMQVPIDTSKMSEPELQFHYFKMHDSDNNNKLDGCELIKSLIHWHADEKNSAADGTGAKNGTTYTDANLADIIDYVLKTMDFNQDGYVDYAEYRKSDEAEKAEKEKAKN